MHCVARNTGPPHSSCYITVMPAYRYEMLIGDFEIVFDNDVCLRFGHGADYVAILVVRASIHVTGCFKFRWIDMSFLGREKAFRVNFIACILFTAPVRARTQHGAIERQGRTKMNMSNQMNEVIFP